MKLLRNKLTLLRDFARNEDGLEMVEWAVLTVIISVAGAFALLLVGANINVAFLQLRQITAAL